jgi:MFS family permease
VSVTALLRREPRALAFGLMHMLAATVGQTFVISLFLPGIKASFGLGNAEVSLLFTITTLVSAAALWKIGARIDRADIARYALWCGVFLALACALVAAARELTLLVVGFFCLRLAGNGLLTHVALTATARHFTRARGLALALVMLGSSLGEASLPALLVPLIGVWGWRASLVATGGFALILVGVAAAAIRNESGFRNPATGASIPAAARSTAIRRSTHAGNRKYFVMTAPLFIAMPMIATATVFHQALVAEAKGVSLQWFAVSFIAFAAARVASSLAIGPLVDRTGSAWLFCVHLAPLAAGTAALLLFSSAWVVPVYWFCAGIASGMGGVLQMTVVAERIALARLGAARSRVAAATIVASAVGPLLFGLALAAGASVPFILWVSVAVLIGATGLGVVATRASTR